MNSLKKKIVYYYLVITTMLLIGEWYLYQFIYNYSVVWGEKTGISESVFKFVGFTLLVFLFCVVSYIYYAKVNKMIVKESERQVKERNILFANISHDLKNPMASVLGFARALEENAVPEAEKDKTYHLIAEKSNQMNDMILKMFQYAKMESDGYSLKLAETDICELVRIIVAERYSDFEENDILLDIDIPDDKLMREVDKLELSRVINNLINNAIKHNDKGIKIFVRVACEGSSLMKIIVADSGERIPKEIENSLFEPFQCSDASRVSKDGSGLGLAITKRIVELHKGRIYVDNNIEGYTKAFVVEL